MPFMCTTLPLKGVVSGLCLRPATGEVVHSMIYADHLSEKPVEDSCREDELPESDEVEAERDSAEGPVPFYGSDDFLCDIFRLQDRDDA